MGKKIRAIEKLTYHYVDMGGTGRLISSVEIVHEEPFDTSSPVFCIVTLENPDTGKTTKIRDYRSSTIQPFKSTCSGFRHVFENPASVIIEEGNIFLRDPIISKFIRIIEP